MFRLHTYPKRPIKLRMEIENELKKTATRPQSREQHKATNKSSKQREHPANVGGFQLAPKQRVYYFHENATKFQNI